MFATGIENSYPTIERRPVRVDEMEKCGHYEHWRDDFDLRRGARHPLPALRAAAAPHLARPGPLRLGVRRPDVRRPAAARHHADRRPLPLRRARLDRQLPEPRLPARCSRDYAGAFAERFPLGAALHAGQRDVHLRDVLGRATAGGTSSCASDRAFVTALKHLVKANVLAMQAILDVRPDAIFIQSESSEYFHADSPSAIKPAEIANSRRFLSLDLNYGRRVDSEMYEYLLDNGMTREEYHFFLGNSLKQHCIMGNDYYVTNEHRVFADGSTTRSGEVFGYDEITWQYYDRYRLPVMHTETNLAPGPAAATRRCTGSGRNGPTCCACATTACRSSASPGTRSPTRSTGTRALREDNGRVNPLGLYDLDRNIRPVGEAYRKIVARMGRRAADAERLPARAGVPAERAAKPRAQHVPARAAAARRGAGRIARRVEQPPAGTEAEALDALRGQGGRSSPARPAASGWRRRGASAREGARVVIADRRRSERPGRRGAAARSGRPTRWRCAATSPSEADVERVVDTRDRALRPARRHRQQRRHDDLQADRGAHRGRPAARPARRPARRVLVHQAGVPADAGRGRRSSTSRASTRSRRRRWSPPMPRPRRRCCR